MEEKKKTKKKKKKTREVKLKALNEGNIDVEEHKEEMEEKKKKKKKNREVKLKALNEGNIDVEEHKEEMEEKKKKNREVKLKALNVGNIDVEENKEEMEEKKKKKKKKREVKLKALNEGNTDVEENKEKMEEKKKKKKKKMKDDFKAALNEKGTEGDTTAGNLEGQSVEHKQKKKDLTRDKIKASTKNVEQKTGASSKRKRTTDTACNERQSKKVKFSSEVEVFPIPTEGSDDCDENINKAYMVRGKRYTKDEDQIIRQAVLDYVKRHQLGENGVKMVMNSRKHKEVYGCWKEIAEAIPYRPRDSIANRAHNIFTRSEKREWTQEELDLVKELHDKYGSNWATTAKELGKYRIHVKDAYRRTFLANRKRGHWSQDEYQTLFDLVNANLEVKAFEEKKSKYGMLKDNIAWSAISLELGTRNNATCCTKWYCNLSSSMVSEGLWADADDYRLLMELYNLDASCEEEVEWDFLIEDRPGDVCRRRWHQMVQHIGEHGIKSFAEQVEVLSKRYCPRLLEIREKLDSRPVVD